MFSLLEFTPLFDSAWQTRVLKLTLHDKTMKLFSYPCLGLLQQTFVNDNAFVEDSNQCS